jgi:hypothetical protein
LPLPAIVLSFCVAGTTVAQPLPDRVVPVEPLDGAVVSGQPIFQIRYEGSDAIHAKDLFFRIALEAVDGSARDSSFDQRESDRGWLAGIPGTVIFRPREPLEDGRYRWQASYWDGVRWAGAVPAREFRVDRVPPADVGKLRVAFDPVRGQVRLAWDPVGLDREGRAEFVARYHVYRYERLAPFPVAKLYEIGTSEAPFFVDLNPGPVGLLLYKVTAEDRAGNEPGARR